MDSMMYQETLNEILAASAKKLQLGHGSMTTESSFWPGHPSPQLNCVGKLKKTVTAEDSGESRERFCI